MDIGTRRGARFGVATVHGILTNPAYTGCRVFNKRDSRLFCGARQHAPLGSHDTSPGRTDPHRKEASAS